MNSAPKDLIRPSSLNYKISLSEAVIDFLKKELPLTSNQYIEVRLEDMKMIKSLSKSQNGKKDMAGGFNTDYTFEDFDDALYDPITPMFDGTHKSSSKRVNRYYQEPNHINSNIYMNEYGFVKENWLKEDK
jgi:hypothetical protein